MIGITALSVLVTILILTPIIVSVQYNLDRINKKINNNDK